MFGFVGWEVVDFNQPEVPDSQVLMSKYSFINNSKLVEFTNSYSSTVSGFDLKKVN